MNLESIKTMPLWQNFTDLYRIVFMGLAKKAFSHRFYFQEINQLINQYIFFALRMFREMRYRPYCFHILISFINDNQQIDERTTYCHTEYIIFIPRRITKRKRKIVWINTGVNTRRRRGFHGYKPEKVSPVGP